MSVYRLHGYGSDERLRLETAPIPEPGAGYVRIRIHAASVNPIDWKIRSGLLKELYPVTLPYIPGRDATSPERSTPSVPAWRAGGSAMPSWQFWS